MINLTGTSDKLRIYTGAATSLDAHASWVDVSANVVTPGRLNTTITAGTATTDIVGSPSANTYRTVKALTLRNNHATLTADFLVKHTDGSTEVSLYTGVLSAGEQMIYDECRGFYQMCNCGFTKRNTVTGFATPFTVSSGRIIKVLNESVNSANTANCPVDVSGLNFPVTADKLYWFRFNVIYTTAATTTGSRWFLRGIGQNLVNITYLNYYVRYSLTTTTETFKPLFQQFDVTEAAAASSAAIGNNWCLLEGICQSKQSGMVGMAFASELAAQVIVARAGSFLEYQQIT